MQRIYSLTALLVVTLLSSCELIGDIFKAGAYTGIIAVVVVIAVIIWIISRFRGRS
jgi:hypothetical protein